MILFFRIFSLCLCIGFCFNISAQTTQAYIDDIHAYRTNYIQHFLAEEDSPLDSAGVKLLSFYEPDTEYRVIAKVKLKKKSKAFEMATSDGTSKLFKKYAVLDFTMKGNKVSIPVYQYLGRNMSLAYPDHLFLPFTDFTNGEGSYGGGRYIDLQVKDIKDGTIVVDFNKAYNPYCTYKSGYRCPVPPKENAIKMEIQAGEKAYAHD